MNLLAIEIKEIRRLQKAHAAGKLSDQQFLAQVAGYNQTLKREELLFKIMATVKESHNGLEKGMKQLGMIGDTVVDSSPEEIEEEKIHCEKRQRVITRSQCLDHSGKAENLEDCRECDYYKINRDLVLGPDKPYVA